MTEPQPTPQPSQPAGLARQLAALAYDWLLIGALVFVFMLVLFIARDAHGDGPPGKELVRIAVIVVAALFYCVFWTHGGQTVGMRAWRIRLVNRGGGPVAWKAALLRFFAAWLSALPLGLGYWWYLVDRRRRTWHDVLSGTAVVRTPKS
ncbi:MAG TPA: RDD family protein [Gammaproteobacteria bacterium]|nr:RDD family protein [Gammaproteobacteria bacterium]